VLVQVNSETSPPWQQTAKARAMNAASSVSSRECANRPVKLESSLPSLEGKPGSPDRCFQTELTDEVVHDLHEQIRAQVAELREKALSAAASAAPGGDISTQVITAQLPVSPVAEELPLQAVTNVLTDVTTAAANRAHLPEAADDANVGKLPVSSLNGRSAPGAKFMSAPSAGASSIGRRGPGVGAPAGGGATLPLGTIPTPLGDGLAAKLQAERTESAHIPEVLEKTPLAAAAAAPKASAPKEHASTLGSAVGGPPVLPSSLSPAASFSMGERNPEGHERHLIESALYKIFSTLEPESLEAIVTSFREWKLPANVAIVQQNSPITTGPGLTVLVDGVVDVLYCPKGTQQFQKVCTYDRCGQLFGELELIYDAPRPAGTARKSHWATVATRVACTMWAIDRSKLITTMRGLRWVGKQKQSTVPAPLPGPEVVEQRELTSV